VVQSDRISLKLLRTPQKNRTFFIVETFYKSKSVVQGQRNYRQCFNCCEAHSRDCVM